MRKRLIGVLLSTILYALPANAWFFQPSPGTVSQETLSRFQEAAVNTLEGLTLIHDMLRQIEQGETSVNSVEAASVAIEKLVLAASQFRDLQTEDLQALIVSIEAVEQIDEGAIQLVRNAKIENAADLSRYSADQSLVIANLVASLLESDFGPVSAANSESRATVNRLVSSISNMMIVVNSVSGALALASQQ
ncbi:hypothetical protein FHS72_001699 [Loktanella ponticola]|uniref:Uncharacterized protein n=1 Tax=Yoonia ponticola TaxID=1524255 RepID=A0A7W9BKF7_9RHOB|nr:hypothetical protein [Yoonia ponticola]MBB5722075.1 hypothetical protein [Yoonia ponticola]